MTQEIRFYDASERPYGIFSNFYKCKIKIDGVVYPNSEAYFQAEKFRGPDSTPASLEYADLISVQTTGNKSAVLARQSKPRQPYPWAVQLWATIQDYQARGVVLRSDWEFVKDNVMRKVVYQKFAQNPKLREVLMSTDASMLVEHTHRDAYWGDGCSQRDPSELGPGKNKLGIILEEVRYLLGGKSSPRFDHMLTFDYSNWVIPGVFLMSGYPRLKQYKEFHKSGFKYIVSLMTHDQEKKIGLNYRNVSDVSDAGEDFCMIQDAMLLARWSIEDRKITSDQKASQIALTIVDAAGRGYPTVLHCFGGKGRAGTITCIAVGYIYGVSGEEAADICQRLFDVHRKNKGRILAATHKSLKRDIPQTKVQLAQVVRILDAGK